MVPFANDGGGRSGGILLPGVLAAAGAALLGYGAYAHFSVVGRTRCDGCAPWHPLFVVAPVVLGAVLVVAGIGLLVRR